MNQKTILITGGAGFLGSHLCAKYINEGHKVICLDNMYTGRMDNIQSFVDNPNFTFIKHDITEPIEIDTKIDQIFNMACPASPPAYQGEYSIHTTKTCILGALHILELALKHDAVILQASTSEVYGDPLESPQSENYRGNVNPHGLRACYDEGKRCAESLFFDYYRHKNVSIKVIRIFNTYGNNMDPDDGRVVSNFICQALSGEDITIYGDGSQTRSFCYVDDLIVLIDRVMNSRREFTGPINTGNPNEFTVKELAHKVLEKIPDTSSKIVYKDLPADDPTRRCPDISLAQREFSWAPQVMLEQGLDKTIVYFAEELRKRGRLS